MTESLRDRLSNHSARVCVIGLGYVGLPLAVELARAGYPVTGLDIVSARVNDINRGRSYIEDVADAAISELVGAGRLSATTDYACIDSAGVVFICVPTPYTEAHAPDLSSIVSAARGIRDHLRADQLVILQSTTYPGTTEEDVLPILEESGLKAGTDFYLAFSPERINPGDPKHTVRNTPKVVGGLTPRCAELSRLLLEQITPGVRVVSSPRAAEMTKLLENIFRSVNIALVNELALLSERMGIDIWEVISAASTKPFGYMPFTPGPGVGGHCIPVDPHYLFWKAREYDFHTKFIELAAEVNQAMPQHTVDRVMAGLNRQGKALRGARVLVLGVAFKRDVSDARNSPAERIVELLLQEGAQVVYNDPHVPEFAVGPDKFLRERTVLRSQPLTTALLEDVDCTVIVAGHTAYDYDQIVRHSRLVVDSVDATRSVVGREGNVVRIGAPLKG